MCSSRLQLILIGAVWIIAVSGAERIASAGVQEYFDDDRDAWFEDSAVIGPITTIGFLVISLCATAH